jgi:type IV pilus assembly protein PilB
MSSEDISKIEPIIYKPYGMILSTGPTGSGKSTTLYSILKKINRDDINIITIEDPIEYRIEKTNPVK